MKTSLLRAVSLLALASSTLSAHAGLLGSTVNVRGLYPDESSPISNGGDRVVGSGIEYGAGGVPGYLDITLDFADATLTVNSISGLPFTAADYNGFDISVVSGAAITSVTFLSGFAPVSYSLSGGHLHIDYAGIDPDAEGLSVFSITTASAPAVPGPLAALPFALMALKRRKRA